MIQHLTNKKKELLGLNKCIHGNYTAHPFTGCKTCGGTIVECSNEKIWPKTRNSKTCNSICKEFIAGS